jgi:hypothetical protein
MFRTSQRRAVSPHGHCRYACDTNGGFKCRTSLSPSFGTTLPCGFGTDADGIRPKSHIRAKFYLKISRECGFFWAFLPHFRETRMVYRSKGSFFLALYLNALFRLVPLKGLHHAAFGDMHLSDGWRSLCCLRAAISTHATRSLRLHHELHGFTQGAPSCSFVLWHGSQSKLASL